MTYEIEKKEVTPQDVGKLVSYTDGETQEGKIHHVNQSGVWVDFDGEIRRCNVKLLKWI